MKKLTAIMAVFSALFFGSLLFHSYALAGTMGQNQQGAGYGAEFGYDQSKMIGMKVSDSSGRNLGTVRDVVLDRDGRVAFLILDVPTRESSELSVTLDKQIAVPYGAFSNQAGSLAFNGSTGLLLSAPDYNQQDLQAGIGQEHWNDLYRHYGVSPYWTEEGRMMNGNQAPMAQGYTLNEGTQKGGLIGMAVRNPDGTFLGTISDVILDRDGKVAFLILTVPTHNAAYSDSNGLPYEKKVAVPFGAFTMGSPQYYVLRATPEFLFSAPAYDIQDLQAGMGPDWVKIYNYYGVRPYWTESGNILYNNLPNYPGTNLNVTNCSTMGNGIIVTPSGDLNAQNCSCNLTSNGAAYSEGGAVAVAPAPAVRDYSNQDLYASNSCDNTRIYFER